MLDQQVKELLLEMLNRAYALGEATATQKCLPYIGLDDTSFNRKYKNLKLIFMETLGKID